MQKSMFSALAIIAIAGTVVVATTFGQPGRQASTTGVGMTRTAVAAPAAAPISPIEMMSANGTTLPVENWGEPF
jgi:hypothetical protein